MIRYHLNCDQGHDFDSWFKSAEAYDALCRTGQLACPDCGSPRVSKALMAPGLRAEREAATPKAEDPRAEALKAFRRKVEAEASYVGGKFAAEARAIHEGTAPERAIYGEARPEEVRRLVDDGIPCAPLPFIPKAQRN